MWPLLLLPSCRRLRPSSRMRRDLCASMDDGSKDECGNSDDASISQGCMCRVSQFIDGSQRIGDRAFGIESIPVDMRRDVADQILERRGDETLPSATDGASSHRSRRSRLSSTSTRSSHYISSGKGERCGAVPFRVRGLESIEVRSPLTGVSVAGSLLRCGAAGCLTDADAHQRR